jgi:DNA-binding CsgD family transcriptional regulator
MLETKTLRSIAALGAEALELEQRADFARHILPRIEDLYGAAASVFLDWSHTTPGTDSFPLNDLHFPHWSESCRQFYHETLRYEDPLFAWLDSGQFRHQRSATRLSSLVDSREFEQTSLFRSLLQPQQCHHILTVALNCGPKLLANISLLRARGVPDFDEEEVQTAQLLSPMLSGAFRKLLLEEQSAGNQELCEVLAGIPPDTAAMVLSEQLQQVFCSVKLQRLAVRLRAASIADADALLQKSACARRYLRLFRHASAARRRWLPSCVRDIVRVDETLSLQISLNRVETSRGSTYLWVGLDELAPAPVAGMVARAALSLRETRIAELVCEGHTCNRIGEQLCISPWTVKNHLKSIYAKLKVNNRAALARMLR